MKLEQILKLEQNMQSQKLADTKNFDEYIELKKLPTYQKLTQEQLKIYDNRPPLGKGQFGKVFEGKLNSGNKQIKDRPF